MNNLTEKEKVAINELVEELKKLYGDNLLRIILYGSKVRGDSVPESDIDLLVVLKNMDLTYDEISKITEISAPICLKYNVVISALPKKEEMVFTDYKTIFIYNVLKEGIEIPL